MSPLIQPLFFYGVLMPELASGRMAELVAMLGESRPATVRGSLYAIPDPRGHYPALIQGDGEVHGRLHLPSERFGRAELAEMDAFEGADYVRRAAVASLTEGRARDCQLYFWNRPIGPEAIPIPHGSFARYLADSGARPLPG